ncbi:MAG: isopentenyl-diphosphate Delta-isomerase [Cyclobacteriaceae bacterium]
MEQVILVDENDMEVGAMEKIEAHKKGVLHRAFSVLLFNSKGEMLLQKRAKGKYHSGGLWSNACCSHPRPGENIEAAVKRRMMEELGIEIQPEFLYKFIYRAEFENDLVEHELDHVFVCEYDKSPNENKEEIEAWKFVDQEYLRSQINLNPEKFTFWLKLIIENYQTHVE